MEEEGEAYLGCDDEEEVPVDGCAAAALDIARGERSLLEDADTGPLLGEDKWP